MPARIPSRGASVDAQGARDARDARDARAAGDAGRAGRRWLVIVFTVTRPIAAPAQDVWPVLADIERWSDWTPTIARVERLGAEPLGTGSRLAVEQPKLRRTVWTITEWAPGRGFTWTSRVPGMRSVAEHVLAPAAGGCVLRLVFRLDGILARPLGRLYGGLIQPYMEREAEGLRERCERGRGSPRP
jgi:hypothetical protein